MGTRGCYGFYKKGKTKATYNHYDSYPTGLGLVVCNAVQNYSTQVMHEAFDRIQLVDERTVPTKEQVELCKQYANLQVGRGNLDDWYCLLREAQFSLEAWLQNDLPFMIDNEEFLGDSLMCEWAYIINLDEEVVEVYEGFQKQASNPANRYSKWVQKLNKLFTDPEGGKPYYYWEVALHSKLPFEEIRKMNQLELKDKLTTIERSNRDE